jgi:hypothetical protein
MAEKRKSNANANNSPSSSKKRRVRCNYCFTDRHPLVEGKPYCIACMEEGDVAECAVCIRPLPSRLVEKGVCGACRRKEKNGTTSQYALDGQLSTEDFPVSNPTDPLESLTDARDEIEESLTEHLDEYHGVKFYIILVVTLSKINRLGEEILYSPSFHGKIQTLLLRVDFQTEFNDQINSIIEKLNEFLQNGSGWKLKSVDGITLSTAAYEPTLGSSYVPTPKYLAKKKALVNVQNDDSKCFLWAVLCGLHPIKSNPQRVEHYKKYEHELNVNDLSFPLNIRQVKKFENLNPTISVNVFAYDGKVGVYPLHITAHKNRQHVNMLLLSQGDKSHYVTIRSMSKLLRQKNSYHCAKFHCNYCLHGFTRQDLLDRHVVDCEKQGLQKVKLVEEKDRWLKFKSIQKMLPVPFIIYCDLESYTCKLNGPEREEGKQTGTNAYELHEPSGYCYHIVSSDPTRTFSPQCYRGPNVIDTLLSELRQKSEELGKILKSVENMKLTPEQERQFQMVKRCYLCNKLLGADRVCCSCRPIYD